jgi:hypothetical protein
MGQGAANVEALLSIVKLTSEQASKSYRVPLKSAKIGEKSVEQALLLLEILLP